MSSKKTVTAKIIPNKRMYLSLPKKFARKIIMKSNHRAIAA